jgi:glucan 1,3-beta-glucosidase
MPVPDDADATPVPIQKQSSTRKRQILLAAVVFTLVAIAAVVASILLSSPKTFHLASPPPSQQSSGPGGTYRPSGTTGATSGGNGSTVTKDNGNTFVCINNVGRDRVVDPTKPFAPGGRAQRWSPRVGHETWVGGQNVARGVNLG